METVFYGASLMSSPDLRSSEEPQPTTNEVAAAYKQASAARERLIGGPLMTKSMRQALEASKPVKTYTRCKIRVKFGDGSLLQASFYSTQTMVDVYSWLDDCLTATAYSLWRFDSQRKRVTYDRANQISVLDHDLCPASVLSIQFQDASLNRTSPVKAEIKMKAQSMPNSIPQVNGSDGKEDKAKKGENGSGLERKVPKWLSKMQGKKG